MAVRLNAAPAPQRTWLVVEPAPQGHAADTHCCICLSPDTQSPILAHRLNDKNLEIGHRVHYACLLQSHDRARLLPNYPNSRDPKCPTCMTFFPLCPLPPLPPPPMGQRIVRIVSEGISVATEIFRSFLKLHSGGLLLIAFCIVQGTIFDLKRGLFPLFTANGFALVNHAMLGSLVSSAIVCITTKISSYILSKMPRPINGRANQNQTFFFWAAKSLIQIISFAFVQASFFRIEARILAQLSPDSRAIYSGLIGENYTCPGGLYKEALDAALLAHDRIRGLALGMGCVFVSQILALIATARRQ